MLDHINISPDSQGKQALEVIQAYIAENKRKFIQHVGNKTISSPQNVNVVGKIGRLEDNPKGYNSEVSIEMSQMESILKDKGFTDVRSVIDDWKDMEILNGEDNKPTRRRSINGANVRCYVLLLQDKLVEDNEQEDRHKAARTQYIRSSAN